MSALYGIEIAAMWADAFLFILGIFALATVLGTSIAIASLLDDEYGIIKLPKWKRKLLAFANFIFVGGLFCIILPFALWIPFTTDIDLGLVAAFSVGMFAAIFVSYRYDSRFTKAVLPIILRLFVAFLARRRSGSPATKG